MRRTLRPLFWSCYLIALGGVLIANASFGANLPVVRLFLGILVIGWGVSVILGGFPRKDFSRRLGEKLEAKAERFEEKMERAAERLERKLKRKGRR